MGRRSRGTALAALALGGALTLAACNGDTGGGAAGPAPGTTPATSPAASAAPPGGPLPPAPAKATPKPTASTTATPAGKPKPPAPAPTCNHKMPISPDEIAVYRYTPEGGAHSLIVRHGNWGCPGPGGAAPFVTVGEETFISVNEDAKISALTPIVAGTVSKPITINELSEWLIAHPNKGLVFHYNVDHHGWIETLGQEEYTPAP
ncbi:hypothetical protein ABZ924_01320 [Streptomyces sp. NPDC046876]|uniref:hypothetical protein n=1 Tax=Streptomyces sp. NPDC046876 TaxID=3155616 RepID=UPI003406B4FC